MSASNDSIATYGVLWNDYTSDAILYPYIGMLLPADELNNIPFVNKSACFRPVLIKKKAEVTPAKIYGSSSTLLVPSVKEVGAGIPREQPLGSVWSYLPYLGLLLLALLLIRYIRKYLRQLPLLLVSYKAAHKQYKSNLQNFNRTLVVMSWFALIPASLLVNYLLQTVPNTLDFEIDIRINLIVLIILTLYSLVKNSFLRISGTLTYSNELIQEIIYNARIYFGGWNLIAFPLVVLLALNDSEGSSQTYLIILTVASLLFFVLYLVRTLQLFLAEKVSPFFWFLYLCTLELLPVVLIIDYLFTIR